MNQNKKQDADETRKAILKTARKLFGKKGFSQTTLTDICTQTGYTKGALFHHFKSKEALFEEIWTELEIAMDTASTQEAIKIIQQTNDPYRGFMAGCRMFLKHVSQPDFQQIVYIDGPSVLGMKEWMKRDAGMGMRNLGSGLKFLASQGLVNEKHRYALTVLAYGALTGIAKTLSFQGDGLRTDADDMFAAFERLIKSAH